jgi:hypothetical protein
VCAQSYYNEKYEDTDASALREWKIKNGKLKMEVWLRGLSNCVIPNGDFLSGAKKTM